MTVTLWQIVLGFTATILTGGGFVALINNLANRGKVSAETRNITISGELLLADGYKKYADDIKADYRVVLERLKILEEKYDALEEKYRTVEDENAILKEHLKDRDDHLKERDARITILEEQVDSLRTELATYQSIKDTKIEEAKVELHNKVDEQLDIVKNPNETT